MVRISRRVRAALLRGERFHRRATGSAPGRSEEGRRRPFFFFDYAGSNSVFLVNDDGVLVIDTTGHK